MHTLSHLCCWKVLPGTGSSFKGAALKNGSPASSRGSRGHRGCLLSSCKGNQLRMCSFQPNLSRAQHLPDSQSQTHLPGHKPCPAVSILLLFVPLPTTGLGRTWIPDGSDTLHPWIGRGALLRYLLQSFTHCMHLLHTREQSCLL